MKSISLTALTAALAVAATLGSAPADAQRKKKEQEAAPATDTGGRKYDFSKTARPLISNLQKAATANDTPGFQAALTAAQAGASTTDDRYAIAMLQLQKAQNPCVGVAPTAKACNAAERQAATEALIASGGATAAELPKLYNNLAIFAMDSGDLTKAAAANERLIASEPGNADAIIRLAELRNKQNRTPEGIQLLERAITARKASGQPVPEPWYKRAVSLSYNAKLMPQAFRITREWLTAYPTDQNWRDALTDYQALVRLDTAGDLDRLRLLRAAKALHGERAYGEYAETAFSAGYPGEAKAVLDEGVARGVVAASKPAYRDLLTRAKTEAAKDRPTLGGLESKASAAATGKPAQVTADAYLSYGDYAKATGLYRTALAKGGAGIDPNLVNTRLGIALAMSGDKAGANAAFGAVTGVRQDLAQYWMLWLAKQA